MHPIKSVLVILSACCLISCGGCATLSKQECLQGDWYAIGYEDGRDGYAYTRLLNHKKACLDYRVSPDEKEYRRGRDDGLVVYCTEMNGYEEGHDIKKYTGSCPPQLERKFLRGYLQGLETAENDLHREVSRKTSEIITATLLLKDLKGEAYEKQYKKVERLESKLREVENKLSDINNLRRQHGLHLK